MLARTIPVTTHASAIGRARNDSSWNPDDEFS
jgi:hypothetical protein